MELEYATYIDHTLLKADARKKDIIKLCKEAREHSFVAVCINPTWVKVASEELAGSTVGVCTVVGFPLGASTSEVKVFETENAIQNGANEIDMVINIGNLQSENNEAVIKDIRSVVNAAKGRALVKVIIETSLLTDKEKKTACELAILGGADFVKTSTGFSIGGATEEDVLLMKSVVGRDLGVKASGGVKDLKDMKKMIHAGASRIGTSSGVKIMNESNS